MGPAGRVRLAEIVPSSCTIIIFYQITLPFHSQQLLNIGMLTVYNRNVGIRAFLSERPFILFMVKFLNFKNFHCFFVRDVKNKIPT